MADSTHLGSARWRTLVAILAVIVLSVLVVPSAHADGDPASDVLAEQPVFIPQGRGIPTADQARLEAVVGSAQRRGYPVRVALIAARSDLGAITPLWRDPSRYAEFLGEELADVFHGTLIVVMPNGYGVWLVGQPGSQAALQHVGASLVGAPLAGAGSATAAAAVTAVERVAAAAGHPLPTPTATSLPAASGTGVFGPVAWIALATGGVMIAGAWAGSLRARPWRRGEGVASPSHGTRAST